MTISRGSHLPIRKPAKTTRKARGAVDSASFKAGKVAAAVKEHFAKVMDLPTFLQSVGVLTNDERKLIVRQALILIEQNYAHLPLKRAMHAVDPVQRLKLLLQTLELGSASAKPSEIEFHREMTDIFTSVRDLHTNYLLPAPFNKMAAFLPFMIEDYFENQRRRYLVSHIAASLKHDKFKPGVEVLYWNGVPIERAVLNHAQRYAGSNREARHARGVETLTTRALIIAPAPDEDWVIVGYRSGDGPMHEIRFEWMVNPPLPAAHEGVEGNLASAAQWAFDLERDVVQRTRTPLFATKAVAAKERADAKRESGAAFGALESALPTVFEARPVTTPKGTFGYIRIRTFYENKVTVEQFVNEFIRLISGLPQNGLIIDVRGNGGGIILCGELLLQTLTAKAIEPEPTQFLNTPLNLQLCQKHASAGTLELGQWIESMELALQTGSTFSAGFPITPVERCNSIGQKYFGPVVLITDALCYSTTDIFAAGFQDHEIGPILGVDGATGAGGANVWPHSLLVQALPGNQSIYKPLPNGAGMRVSMRRTLRVGRRAGMPVEDLGVVPDERHFLTRNDLLNGNIDMINAASALLAKRPVYELSVEVKSVSASESKIKTSIKGITRLDVYIDGRPMETTDVNGAQATFTIKKATAVARTAEIRGFSGEELVARYRVEV